MSLWTYVIPPLAGLVIGYFTNDIAIRMLFRPYREYRILGIRVPFTPGLIPQNQPRLARKISETIMGSLLTPEELHNLARKLLATERVQSGIRWLLDLALSRLQNPTQQQNTALVLGRILEDLFGQSLPRLLKVITRQDRFLEGPVNQLFDQVLLELRLSPAQARQFADWILEQALPPPVLRQGLVNFLTDRNIDTLYAQIRERASGTYWLVANLVGAKSALLRLRTFCLEDPEEADRILTRLLNDLAISRRLAETLQDFSLQNLPVVTVKQLRESLRGSLQEYLRSRGTELIQGFKEAINWSELAGLILRRLSQSPILSRSLDEVSLDLAQILERYLEADLEKLMAQILPVLDLDRVIAERVKATSPADLERGIQQIVRQELQGIVNLGGILGFFVGCLQTLWFWWQGTI
ncbi:MAG: DUF445 family protein [Thermostichales cyanobacterium DRC_bins_46]